MIVVRAPLRGQRRPHLQVVAHPVVEMGLAAHTVAGHTEPAGDRATLGALPAAATHSTRWMPRCSTAQSMRIRIARVTRARAGGGGLQPAADLAGAVPGVEVQGDAHPRRAGRPATARAAGAGVGGAPGRRTAGAPPARRPRPWAPGAEGDVLV